MEVENDEIVEETIGKVNKFIKYHFYTFNGIEVLDCFIVYNDIYW